MRAAKYTILTFTHFYPTAKVNSFKNGQHCCPFLLGENSRYSKSVTWTDQQKNWKYLMSKEVTITAEYLPGALNKEVDMQSQP